MIPEHVRHARGGSPEVRGRNGIERPSERERTRALGVGRRGEFGISSLGAYERGDRVLSVDRLIRLAEIYRVDVSDLMPDRTETLLDLPALEQPHLPAGLVLDPSRLRVLSEDAAAAASNFRAVILALRRTHAQEVVVVRKSDSAVLAAFVGCDTSLVDRLLAPAAAPRARVAIC